MLLIGHGALARWLIDTSEAQGGFDVVALLVRNCDVEEVQKARPAAQVVASVDALTVPVELAIEVAGAEAVTEHVSQLLARGVNTAIASTGALARAGVLDRLLQCAEQGKSTLKLLSGAVGGLDLLAVHRQAGLKRVVYTGRKPPLAWKGPHAPKRTDVESTIFEGTAREAAIAFPSNANVAATIALAGAGLDRTEVRLVSDPSIGQNLHVVEAESEVGSFRLEMSGRPLASNPSTSALTAFSALNLLSGLTQTLII
ncbi:MAG: aspartate dehydrogenase [Pseudomonadota bacterium]